MFVAICFFGKMGVMDTFMATSLERCVTAPLQKYFQDEGDVVFQYYLHTYFTGSCMQNIDILRNHFHFLHVSIQDEKHSMHGKRMPRKQDLFSLDRCMKMVERDADYAAFVRLDLLFTRPLSVSDIGLAVEQGYVLTPAISPARCFAFGKKKPLLSYVNGLTACVVADPAIMLPDDMTEPQAKISRCAQMCVRVLADGSVHKHDRDVCPYLNDLIMSTTTRVLPFKEKKPQSVK